MAQASMAEYPQWPYRDSGHALEITPAQARQASYRAHSLESFYRPAWETDSHQMEYAIRIWWQSELSGDVMGCWTTGPYLTQAEQDTAWVQLKTALGL